MGEVVSLGEAGAALEVNLQPGVLERPENMGDPVVLLHEGFGYFPSRRYDREKRGDIAVFVNKWETLHAVLLHLDLPHRPPRVSPARGPPQAELHLDQSPAFDLAASEALPEFEFDQSSPQDWAF